MWHITWFQVPACPCSSWASSLLPSGSPSRHTASHPQVSTQAACAAWTNNNSNKEDGGDDVSKHLCGSLGCSRNYPELFLYILNYIIKSLWGRYYFFKFLKMFIDFREREKHRLVASHIHPNEDRTHNLGMCPDRESNLQPFGCTGQSSNQLGHICQGSTIFDPMVQWGTEVQSD